MAEYIYGLGKGLKEPCPPYRSDYIFGAALNDFDADWWNCVPEIWDATTTFALSPALIGREVVVALLGIHLTAAGLYHISFKWYRDRDNKILYDYGWSEDVVSGSWLYGYSYIGYVDWEIIENGSYRVEIAVTGAGSFSRTIPFTISGVVEEEPLPDLPEKIIDSIFSMVWTISELFHGLAFNTRDIPIVGGIVSEFFNLIYRYCWYLLTPIARFGDWVREVTNKVATILDFYDIFDLFIDYWRQGTDAWRFIQYLPTWLAYRLTEWWDTVRPTILSWIADSRYWTTSQLNSLQATLITLITDVEGWTTTQLNNLQATFVTLISNVESWTLTQLNSFKSVVLAAIGDIRQWTQTEINTIQATLLALVSDTRHWSTAQMNNMREMILGIISDQTKWTQTQINSVRDMVLEITNREFFTDPEDWLYKAFDRIIERFW